MPNWPADDTTVHARAFAWTPYWVLAFVALWPLPGIAEGVLGLGALAVAVQLAVTLGKGRSLPLDRRAAWLLGALFAAYWLPELLSAPDALSGSRAWKEVAGDLRYLPFLWGVAIALHTPAGRTRVLDGLAWVVAIWTVDGLAQAALGTSPLFWSLDGLKRALGGDGFCSAEEILAADRLAGVFGPCNLKLGLVLASLSPFALFAAGKRFGLWGWSLAAATLGVVILLAGARAAWLTFGLVLVFSGWRLLGWKKLLGVFLFGGLSLLVLGMTSSQFRERIERTTQALNADESGVDTALSGRSQIWKAAVCMIREHPVNGVGTRNFRLEFPACDPTPGAVPAWGGGPAHHAHQIVLEILSETGFIGLLLWLAGAAMAWRAWRYASTEAKERARPAMLALAVTVFPFNTHLAFYSTFWGGLTLLLAALYAGSLLASDDG